MEQHPDENLAPIPQEVFLEVIRRMDEAGLTRISADDPLAHKIPRKYFRLDRHYINNLVRAGVRELPDAPGIEIVRIFDDIMDKLRIAHQQMGTDLEAGHLDNETNEMLIQRIVRTVLGHLAHGIEEEKTFMVLAREAYRQAHGTPRRGRRSLKNDCFWAIDSGLGSSGHGFPPSHWVQRAYSSGIPLPPPFNDASRPHSRPTMAELIRMIQDQVPDPRTGKTLPKSTATKYARLWEAEEYSGKLNMSERWALHKARPKAKKARR